MSRKAPGYRQNFNRRNGMMKLQAHRILISVAIVINGFSVLSACTQRSDVSYATKRSEIETAPAAEAISGTSEGSDLGETEAPPAELIEDLKTVLAAEAGVPITNLWLKEATAAQWSDACLGVPSPSEICAQVITPGYRIVLGTLTETYEFHTDQMGENFRRVNDIPIREKQITNE